MRRSLTWPFLDEAERRPRWTFCVIWIFSPKTQGCFHRLAAALLFRWLGTSAVLRFGGTDSSLGVLPPGVRTKLTRQRDGQSRADYASESYADHGACIPMVTADALHVPAYVWFDCVDNLHSAQGRPRGTRQQCQQNGAASLFPQTLSTLGSPSLLPRQSAFLFANPPPKRLQIVNQEAERRHFAHRCSSSCSIRGVSRNVQPSILSLWTVARSSLLDLASTAGSECENSLSFASSAHGALP
jgi:hypothetical protein